MESVNYEFAVKLSMLGLIQYFSSSPDEVSNGRSDLRLSGWYLGNIGCPLMFDLVGKEISYLTN